MKSLFDQVSVQCSKLTTKAYSTSFSLGKTNTINANIAGKKIKLVNMDYPAKNTNMIVATTPSATNMAYCCIFPVCNDFNPVAELLTNSLAL